MTSSWVTPVEGRVRTVSSHVPVCRASSSRRRASCAIFETLRPARFARAASSSGR